MLMEIKRFWSIISDSRETFDPNRLEGNWAEQAERLQTALSQLSPQEIGAFENRFRALFHEAYRWDLWAAAYIIEGGCSDDGFTDFRYWLISMGQETYEQAIEDVESLADIAFSKGIEANSWEEFGYIAHEVLEQLSITEEEAGLQNLPWPKSPTGHDWKGDDLSERFPRLVAAEAQHRS